MPPQPKTRPPRKRATSSSDTIDTGFFPDSPSRCARTGGPVSVIGPCTSGLRSAVSPLNLLRLPMPSVYPPHNCLFPYLIPDISHEVESHLLARLREGRWGRRPPPPPSPLAAQTKKPRGILMRSPLETHQRQRPDAASSMTPAIRPSTKPITTPAINSSSLSS